MSTSQEVVNVHRMARDFARAFKPMEDWEAAGKLPDLRKVGGRAVRVDPDECVLIGGALTTLCVHLQYGEDTWEDQIVREYYIAYHRVGHHLWNFFLTLPGRSARCNPARHELVQARSARNQGQPMPREPAEGRTSR